MKQVIVAIVALVRWILVLGTAYAWLVLELEGPGNVLAFWLWASGLAGLMLLFARAQGTTRPLLPPVLRGINGALEAILMCALIWFGHFGYAVLYALSLVGWAAHRSRYDAAGNPKPVDQGVSHG